MFPKKTGAFPAPNPGLLSRFPVPFLALNCFFDPEISISLFAIAILPLEIVEIIQIFMFAGIADYGNRYWIHILTTFVWIASLAYMIGICLVRSRYDERVRTIYQPYGGVQQQNRFIFIM